MRVLGIDPGSKRTGWCLLVDGEVEEAGVIELTTTLDLSERMALIYDEVRFLIQTHEPDMVGVESPFLGKQPSAVIGLARISGVILAAIGTHMVEWKYVPPPNVKKAVGCKGNAGKGEVRAAVRKAHPDLPDHFPDDTYDAVAIGMACS